TKAPLYRACWKILLQCSTRQALALLEGPGSAREILLKYVSLQFDFISTRHRHAALFQQFMSAGNRASETLVRKYITPRSRALERLLERGMRNQEFRRAHPLHTAVSIVGLVVFYFSAEPVLRVLGPANAYDKANL